MHFKNAFTVKTLPIIVNFLSGVLVTFFIMGQFAFKETEKDKTTQHTPVDEHRPPSLPQQISFAEEPVPLERWEIKERLDREVLINYFNTANIFFLLKMANRYFPEISERLKANGVPDDFKYLCVAESNLLPTAVSRAGAISFWQFMGGTAPGYNLVVNSEIDERYHLEKATDAACKYFKQAYQKFGSWTAAAASYNCGQGGYNKQAVLQQTKNYYDLLLPEETNRYMFRILAFKHLLGNAESLGFSIAEDEKYKEIPYRLVTVTSSIHNLAQFAINNGTTYKMVKLLNPWLRSNTLTLRSGSTYSIRLPQQ